jgi:hypothetical protein
MRLRAAYLMLVPQFSAQGSIGLVETAAQTESMAYSVDEPMMLFCAAFTV